MGQCFALLTSHLDKEPCLRHGRFSTKCGRTFKIRVKDPISVPRSPQMPWRSNVRITFVCQALFCWQCPFALPILQASFHCFFLLTHKIKGSVFPKSYQSSYSRTSSGSAGLLIEPQYSQKDWLMVWWNLATVPITKSGHPLSEPIPG